MRKQLLHFGKIRKQRGMTIVELMISMALTGMLTSIFVALIVMNSKAFFTFQGQLNGQMSASREMYRSTELLRNASFSSIKIYNNNSLTNDTGNRIDFESIATPTGQISRIIYANGILRFIPDVSDTSDRIETSGLNNVTFTSTGQMIEITTIFEYRKLKGYGKTQANKMNGTFTTRVYPRNS